jgi:hypothetical protein
MTDQTWGVMGRDAFMTRFQWMTQQGAMTPHRDQAYTVTGPDARQRAERLARLTAEAYPYSIETKAQRFTTRKD